MKRKNGKSGLNLATLIMTAILAGLIGYLVYTNWQGIVAFQWRLHLGYLALVLFFHSLALLATFWAWHLMVRRLGGFSDLPLSFRFYYISNLAKRLPTSLPYIGGRLVMYKQQGVSRAAIGNCILLENILIGIAGAFTFLVLLPFYSNVPEGVTLPLGITFALIIGLMVLRPRLLSELTNRILKRLNRQEMDKMPSRGDLLLWTGIYILPWLFAGASLYFMPRAISPITSLKFFDALEVSTLATLVSLLYFIIPGGLGLKEVTATALLAIWMPFSAALVISLVYRLVHTANEIVWALLALMVPYSQPDQNGTTEPVKGPESPH